MGAKCHPGGKGELQRCRVSPERRDETTWVQTIDQKDG